MATAPIYCTHKELKRVFPQLNEFDTKTPVYGWSKVIDMSAGGSGPDDNDLYTAADCGLITQLYWDGIECTSLSSSQVALLNGTVQSTTTSFDVDGGHGIEGGDIIKIGNEYMYIASVSTNELSCTRGLFHTHPSDHADDSPVNLILDLSEDPANVGLALNANPLAYYYDSDLDFVFLIVDGEATGGANPADHLLEAGEDFSTVVTQFRTDASRYLDSRLDPNLPKNQLKDKSANFN